MLEARPVFRPLLIPDAPKSETTFTTQLRPHAFPLDSRGVEHDADGGTEGPGGKGSGELGANNAGVACEVKVSIHCSSQKSGKPG